jgi:UDP-N-acetylglucosamine 4,6-dehydratase
MKGGEIFIPKAKSYKILDLAKAIDPKKKLNFIGIRPGEKIHETLISESESDFTHENKNFFIINSHGKKNNYKKLKKVKKNFFYSSNQNSYIKINELKKIIKDQFNNQF